MSEVQWNALFNAPNPGAAFTQAFEGAQQRRREDAIMQERMQEHQEDRARLQHEEAMKAAEAHRDNILKGAQIIRQVNPKDDASWQQALGMAQQLGIDLSGVPTHYDPTYAQGLIQVADTFEPVKVDRPQLVPYTQGGGVAAYDPASGQIRTLIAPNDGGHAPGSPVNAPPVLTDEQMRQMMNGGQPASPAGGFR